MDTGSQSNSMMSKQKRISYAELILIVVSYPARKKQAHSICLKL